MHDLAELVHLSAIRQADLVRRGEVTAVELTRAHLERIEQFNHRVNAIVSLDGDRAVARAAAADALPAERRGPLHGLPIAIKDTAHTAGLRTTYGHPLFAANVPEANDFHVERILQAGAVLMGKTNVPEFAAGSHTVNRVFGATRNPHDPTRSAGGSSGGAAASLAARFVPIADGSDMGGSLRNPASFCGVVGMRPTPGVVPNPNATNVFNPLATNGPMARAIRDVALLLSVMARPQRGDARSPTRGAHALEELVPADLRGLRIAYAPDVGGRVPVDRDVRTVIAGAAAVLEAAGAVVELACPDVSGADQAFRVLRAAEFDADWHDLLETHPDGFVDFLADNIRAGARLSGRDVMRAYEEITRLTRGADAFFEDYDLVLAPAAQLPPFPVDWAWPREVDGAPMCDYLEWMRAAWLFTPLGLPALSLPAGFTSSGLPVGVQLLTRAGDDHVLLSIALAIEEALDVPRTDPLAKEQ